MTELILLICLLPQSLEENMPIALVMKYLNYSQVYYSVDCNHLMAFFTYRSFSETH